MLNQDFPRQGSGQDAMVARGLMNVGRWGFFFVPPDSDDPVGTVMLKPDRSTLTLRRHRSTPSTMRSDCEALTFPSRPTEDQ